MTHPFPPPFAPAVPSDPAASASRCGLLLIVLSGDPSTPSPPCLCLLPTPSSLALHSRCCRCPPQPPPPKDPFDPLCPFIFDVLWAAAHPDSDGKVVECRRVDEEGKQRGGGGGGDGQVVEGLVGGWYTRQVGGKEGNGVSGGGGREGRSVWKRLAQLHTPGFS